MRLAKQPLSQDPGTPRLARQRANAIKLYQTELTGIHSGRQARRKDRAEILLKHLGLRFGRLSAATQARVQGATAEQLDAWVERVLTARTLAEVFAQ